MAWGCLVRPSNGVVGWIVFGLVAITGLFILIGRVHTPGYFSVLEVHRIAGWVLCVVAPIALGAHLVKTGSRAWLTGMCLALGGVLSLQVVGALDFPEPMGFVEQQRQALFESQRISDFQDATIIGAAVLAGLLMGSAILTLIGILSRARERSTSRWSGSALVLLAAWALAGGAVLHWQPRTHLFGTLTLHSVAGTGTLALLALHLFAQRAARSNAPRLVVATAGVIWMLGAAGGWWTYYEYEHFRGFRPTKVAEALPVWRTAYNEEEFAQAADPHSDWPRVPEDRFMGAVTCGAVDCHAQNTKEWAGSPHRFSASNQFYRSAVQEIIDAKGVAAAVFCANCHDPERALRGTIAEDYKDGVPAGGSDGVSCEVCHGIVGVDGEPPGDPPANARFAAAFDAPYPGHGARQERNIRLDPRRHRQAFVTNNMTLRATPCQACHRVELGDHLVVQNPTVMSQFFGAGGVACTTCHLPQDAAATYTHHMSGHQRRPRPLRHGTGAGRPRTDPAQRPVYARLSRAPALSTHRPRRLAGGHPRGLESRGREAFSSQRCHRTSAGGLPQGGGHPGPARADAQHQHRAPVSCGAVRPPPGLARGVCAGRGRPGRTPRGRARRHGTNRRRASDARSR